MSQRAKSSIKTTQSNLGLKRKLTNTTDQKWNHKPCSSSQQLVKVVHCAEAKQGDEYDCCSSGGSIVVKYPRHDGNKESRESWMNGVRVSEVGKREGKLKQEHQVVLIYILCSLRRPC
jgi:hypothetical protein